MKKMAVDSLLALSLVCLLTTFVEAVYTFGLLGTDIPPQIICVLFLLSPVLLIAFPRFTKNRAFAVVTGCAALACWAISMPLATLGRMLMSGAGCGLFLLFLPARIKQSEQEPGQTGASAALGILLLVALRATRSGNLLLSDGLGLGLGITFAAAGIVLLLAEALGATVPVSEPSPAGDPTGAAVHGAAPSFGGGRVVGLCLGLFALLLTVYGCFSSPTVLSRWAEASYTAVTAVQVGSLVLAVGACAVPWIRKRMGGGLVAAWNVLFLLSLTLTLLLRQPRFAGGGYPVAAPDPGLPGGLTFWVTLALHPVLYVDLGLLISSLHSLQPRARTLAGGFVIGGLVLLLGVFSQVFTTVYDYIPVVGPAFRNGYWLALSVPAAVGALSLLLMPKAGVAAEVRAPRRVPAAGVAAAVVVAGGAILLAAMPAGPVSEPLAPSSLRLMSYNLQQGYGRTGEKSFTLQRDVLRRVQPDILGIEETDTARIAGGNEDLVRYLADSLGMHSYYGPTPVSGTFGVALLSRYPIVAARTFFMPSRGEQTAAIDARILVRGKPVEVLVTHLDNDGAMPQQRLVVQRAVSCLQDATPPAFAVALGDFNFDPSTEQYRFTTGMLEDAWMSAEQKTVETGASDPAGRIDHVFLTPGTRVLSGRYLPEGPSDHPAIVVEVALPR